jgi:hypothetical protein
MVRMNDIGRVQRVYCVSIVCILNEENVQGS